MKLLSDAATDVFGQITPPPQLQPFINKGGAGAGGISLFLNNLIIMIYIIAAVAFVFMLLWGALQWMLSGGEKEAVAGARNRIIHALIGIVLFAVAFAVIRLVGTFTGFNFVNKFENYYFENNPTTSQVECIHRYCPSGVNKEEECVIERVDASKCKP